MIPDVDGLLDAVTFRRRPDGLVEATLPSGAEGVGETKYSATWVAVLQGLGSYMVWQQITHPEAVFSEN